MSTLYLALLFALLAISYRLYKKFKRRCPHCGSMDVIRKPTRTFVRIDQLGREIIRVDFDRICNNKQCVFFSVIEPEKPSINRSFSAWRNFWDKTLHRT